MSRRIISSPSRLTAWKNPSALSPLTNVASACQLYRRSTTQTMADRDDGYKNEEDEDGDVEMDETVRVAQPIFLAGFATKG